MMPKLVREVARSGTGDPRHAAPGPGHSRLAIDGTLRVADTARLRLESFDLSATVALPDPAALAGPFGQDASWLGALQASGELSLTDGRIDLAIDAGALGALRLEGDGAIGAFITDGALHLAPDIALVATAARSAPALAHIAAGATGSTRSRWNWVLQAGL